MTATDTSESCAVPMPINEPALRRERPEPDEARHGVHPIALAVFIGMSVWGAAYFALYSGDDFKPHGGDQRSPVAAVSEGPDGKAIFAARCASCHQANGQGVPGAFPPLAASSWITDDHTAVRILLRGITGPIEVNGASYNGVMPPFGTTLSDAEVAAVLTYVRGSFGNTLGPIDAARVARVRTEQAAHPEPWAGGAALQAAAGR